MQEIRSQVDHRFDPWSMKIPHAAGQLSPCRWQLLSLCSQAHACAQSLQSCVILCIPMDCILPGSSLHGILQARILEWVAMPSSWGSSWPRDWTQVYCIVGGFFTYWTTWEGNWPHTQQLDWFLKLAYNNAYDRKTFDLHAGVLGSIAQVPQLLKPELARKRTL